MLLHHVGKLGAQRGTSAREDNVDCSIILKSPNDYMPEDGCRFVCSFSKARVGMAGLSLISDAEFKLIEDETGGCVWTYKNVKKESKEAILEMKDKGISQKDIGETLGIDKGYVSRIIKRAIRDGHLTKDGKLTQSGMKDSFG